MRVTWTVEAHHDSCQDCLALIDPALDSVNYSSDFHVCYRGEDDHSVVLIRSRMNVPVSLEP